MRIEYFVPEGTVSLLNLWSYEMSKRHGIPLYWAYYGGLYYGLYEPDGSLFEKITEAELLRTYGEKV